MEENRKNEVVKKMMDMEFYPQIVDEQSDISTHEILPFTKLATLGVAFEPLSQAFKYVTSGGKFTGGTCKVTIPKGTHLTEFIDGSGYMGAARDASNNLVSQARINPLVCDPMMLCMAVALANIDKKLDSIQEMQQELLEFLVEKERSEMQGDLNFLSDVLNNYKYNWNNEKYKNSNHIKVLDIKQSAERKIDFYRKQITKKLDKKSFLHSDQEVKKQLQKVQSDFKDYQLSLYLYSFASFLEVMLLENFDEAYLNSITQKIEGYSFQYRELYTRSYEQIELKAKSSLQSNLLGGAAFVNKTVGKTLAKIPVLNRSQIDETLIESGSKLGRYKSKRTEQTLEQLLNMQDSYVQPFIDNVKTVNRLYNEPIELLFDQENLYLSTNEN